MLGLHILGVMYTYVDARTVVRAVYGNSKVSDVGARMYQGSGLSALLFVTVMEAISRQLRVGFPRKLLRADDSVVTVDSEQQVIRKFNVWKRKD